MKTVIYRVKSPAKINLGLRVLSKRKDGYHNIETIFYPVNLFDMLTVRIAPSNEKNSRPVIKIKSNINKINNKENICYKAVQKFFKELKIDTRSKIQIDITKNIPIGAGLGGGSSNAASVMKVLAKHFNISVKRREVLKLARILGSDVPFFLVGKPAYAESRGEKLTPLPGFRIRHKILIVNPNINVSTKWAYGKLKIKNQIAKSKTLTKVGSFDLLKLKLFENDFEKVVFEKYPEIKSIKDKMYNLGAVFGSMSGSGSTVYGLFNDKTMKQAGKYFKSKHYKVFFV